jgi:hypothetical protein
MNDAQFNAEQRNLQSECNDGARVRSRMWMSGERATDGELWSIVKFVKGAINGCIENGSDKDKFKVY